MYIYKNIDWNKSNNTLKYLQYIFNYNYSFNINYKINNEIIKSDWEKLFYYVNIADDTFNIFKNKYKNFKNKYDKFIKKYKYI